MKNFSKVAVIVCLALALVLCAVACQPDMPSEGQVTIVVAPLEGEASEYKVDLSNIAEGGGVVAILDYLQANEGLGYEMQGTYLNKIGVLDPNPSNNEFIAIYTSVSKDKGAFPGVEPIEYNGNSLSSAAVGVVELSVEDGAIIYFTICTW